MITLTFLFPPSEFFQGHSLDVDIYIYNLIYIYISFQKPRKAAVVRALLLLGAWREVKSRRGETPEVKAGGDFLRGGGERSIRKPRNAVIYSYIHETKFRMVSICYLFFIVIGSAAL